MKVSGRQTGVVGKLNYFDILDWFTFSVVGKGAHTPPTPFLRFPPFYKSKMSPPFIGLSRKKY